MIGPKAPGQVELVPLLLGFIAGVLNGRGIKLIPLGVCVCVCFGVVVCCCIAKMSLSDSC